MKAREKKYSEDKKDLHTINFSDVVMLCILSCFNTGPFPSLLQILEFSVLIDNAFPKNFAKY